MSDPILFQGSVSIQPSDDTAEFGDGDLEVAGTITVDAIDEYTTDTGVTIEGIVHENSHLTIPEITAPADPSAGFHRAYFDSSDSKLKSRDSSSVITVYQPTTTKGDITVHNGTTQVRLPVGTNDFVLKADSAQTAGIKWEEILPYEYQYSASETISSTTSSTYQVKTTLTTTTLSGGDYYIGYSYEWQYSAVSRDFDARVRLDATTDLANQFQEPADAGSDQWAFSSGFNVSTLSAASHTITIEYRASGSFSDTSSIRKARLIIWKVA